MLGWWNGEAGDDLKPRAGGAPVNPGDATAIHYTFGQSCEFLYNRAKRKDETMVHTTAN